MFSATLIFVQYLDLHVAAVYELAVVPVNNNK